MAAAAAVVSELELEVIRTLHFCRREQNWGNNLQIFETQRHDGHHEPQMGYYWRQR